MRGLSGDEAETGADPGGQKPENEISLDFRGKKPGRGAYLCPQESCLKRAQKSKALERAFALTLPPQVFDALEEQIREVPPDES